MLYRSFYLKKKLLDRSRINSSARILLLNERIRNQEEVMKKDKISGTSDSLIFYSQREMYMYYHIADCVI